MANGFCKNCGTELNGARFCPGCGAPADGEIVKISAAVDVRQQSLAEMDNLIRYFSVKQSVFDEKDKAVKEMAECSAKSYAGWYVLAVAVFILGSLGPLSYLPGLIGAVVVLVLKSVLKKKNKKKIERLEEKIEKLEFELSEYHNAYGNCPLGVEYVDPVYLNALNRVMRQGRASTISEALNLLLTDLHQMKMLDLQQEATEAAKDAASYSAANFWLKD